MKTAQMHRSFLWICLGRALVAGWGTALLVLISFPSLGLGASAGGPCHYTLIDGSTLVDDCAICDPPTILWALSGGFDLRKVDENPLFTYYTLENIEFKAGYEGGPHYLLTGRGDYQIGGEVAVVQSLHLELQIEDGSGGKTAYFTNDTAFVDRRWPMFHVAVSQTNGTLLQSFYLDLRAAPFQDLWFSTVSGMTSGTTPPPFVHYENSDLLSITGRRVKSNGELTQQLGIMPIVPDIGLDAVDVLPGGEIAFSATQDIFSETLGPLQHGDILSNHGKILRRNQDLIAPFSPMPPVPDLGLDAVQAAGNDVFYFSISSNIFSERLGQTLRRGDLLSSAGTIVRTQEQLLARFHPTSSAGTERPDYGLDAVYVWPNEGEIWFSTEDGFESKDLGLILPGDLLSDEGYIVYRNLNLVSAFAPLEDLADFGLDSLTVVTDLLPAAPEPVLSGIELRPKEDGLRLEWKGDGRFFQVFGAPEVKGPYTPFSPIMTDQVFQKDGVLSEWPAHYFQIRQW